MDNALTILISPLEWGLGHAGRIIPLARVLHARGHKVIIGSGKKHEAFLRKELPGMEYIFFPGFSIRYSGRFPQHLVILAKLPQFAFHCLKEHFALGRLLNKRRIDIIISDSRIGLFNKRTRSVLILHFPAIPLPQYMNFLRRPASFLSRSVMKKFTFCFIPDLPGEDNLTGILSHGIKLPHNTRYTGILSRFTIHEGTKQFDKGRVKYTVILSGPEPQKTILKEKLTEVLRKTGEKSVILEGEPSAAFKKESAGNMTFISHLHEEELLNLLLNTEVIISRPGYTTIMELASIGKKAVLIPTPGQTEQEYLVEYLTHRGWYAAMLQEDCEMLPEIQIPEAPLPADIVNQSFMLLTRALDELLEE